MPTLLPQPCPSGPVVVSTPAVKPYSGCPGHLLPSCRNRLISSSVTAGPPRLFSPPRGGVAVNRVEAQPLDSTTRTRTGPIRPPGSYTRKPFHNLSDRRDLP